MHGMRHGSFLGTLLFLKQNYCQFFGGRLTDKWQEAAGWERRQVRNVALLSQHHCHSFARRFWYHLQIKRFCSMLARDANLICILSLDRGWKALTKIATFQSHKVRFSFISKGPYISCLLWFNGGRGGSCNLRPDACLEGRGLVCLFFKCNYLKKKIVTLFCSDD